MKPNCLIESLRSHSLLYQEIERARRTLRFQVQAFGSLYCKVSGLTKLPSGFLTSRSLKACRRHSGMLFDGPSVSAYEHHVHLPTEELAVVASGGTIVFCIPKYVELGGVTIWRWAGRPGIRSVCDDCSKKYRKLLGPAPKAPGVLFCGNGCWRIGNRKYENYDEVGYDYSYKNLPSKYLSAAIKQTSELCHALTILLPPKTRMEDISLTDEEASLLQCLQSV